MNDAVLTISLLLSMAVAAAAEELPSITYGPERSSDRWVGTEKSPLVAVDSGIEFRGTSYYISLTSDLVALPDGASHAIWLHPISSFWQQLAVERITDARGEVRLALVLRHHAIADDAAGEGDGLPRIEARDLETGLVIELPPDEDLGTAIQARELASGAVSALAEPFQEIAGSREALDDLLARMFETGTAPDLGTIDFEHELVLVVSYGDAFNCEGVFCRGAWADDARVLIRIDGRYYQTAQIVMGDGEAGDEEVEPEAPQERPYGIWALPRRPGLPVRIERDVQGIIMAPPIWRLVRELAPPPAGE
jgi:hypothetical protein